MGNKSKYIQFDEEFQKQVEAFGYMLGSFTTKDFMLNATEDHSVYVYELDKRKFWVRKYEGQVIEFREIT